MITQKEQAIAIIALSNVVNGSYKFGDGTKPSKEQVDRLHKCLQRILPAARILTDKELTELALQTMEKIVEMPVEQSIITPDPSTVPVQ